MLPPEWLTSQTLCILLEIMTVSCLITFFYLIFLRYKDLWNIPLCMSSTLAPQKAFRITSITCLSERHNNVTSSTEHRTSNLTISYSVFQQIELPVPPLAICNSLPRFRKPVDYLVGAGVCYFLTSCGGLCFSFDVLTCN